LYAKDDIDRLVLLKRVVQGGHGISHVAGLESAQLTQLAALGPAQPVDDPAHAYPHADEILPERLHTHIDDCLHAVGALDAWRLQRLLIGIAASCTRQLFLEAIIRPLMAQVGHRWSDGTFRIVHGQLASAVVHTMPAGMLYPADDQDDRPRLLIATPAGQRCCLGALAVAVTVQDCGWQPVLVGFDLPADEIAAAHGMIAPQLTALSITCRLEAGFMEDELDRLCGALGPLSDLIVGGRASQSYLGAIEAVGGTVFSTTADLAQRIA
jgi:hypothetical protein